MKVVKGAMERALTGSLQNAPVQERDKAAVQLCRRYAQLLDRARGEDWEVETYNELGPKLLSALTALGLTVAGRGVKGGEPVASPAVSVIDELAKRRGRTA